MADLLKCLDPEGIELKGRMVSSLYENPFLEASAATLALRCGVETSEAERALNDLCRCDVLKQGSEGYRFDPKPSVYESASTLAAASRGEEETVRRQVEELETVARLREALAVTHQEVSAILDMVPAGVLLLDRFGHLLKSNRAALDLLGLAAEGAEIDVCEVLGLDLARILDQEVLVEVEGRPPLEVRSRPFQVTGSDTGAVITVQDISERREVEDKASRMREEFFSMIRHELRKPLLTLDRLLGSLAGGEELEQAQAASSHLGAMVDDMLFLARLERDPMAVRPEDTITLKLLMAGGNLAYRNRAAEAGLSLSMVPPDEDTRFRGDERRLNQVVSNLLDNAIKFTPRGGEVVLRGGRQNGTVWISVTDSGPGIPAGERSRIFGKFVQIRSDEGRSAGLGLGLAICQRVVLAHGGQIEVSAAAAGGAVFTVRLPETPRLPEQVREQTRPPADPTPACPD